MSNILEKISAQVQLRMKDRQKELSYSELEKLCAQSRKAFSLKNAFDSASAKLAVLSEVKFASPSQGIFPSSSSLSPVQVAKDYIDNGAIALSVLTEADNFHGSFQYLIQIRKAFPQAVLLMKDFISDPYQILEAQHLGADAILLIVALLEKTKLKELYQIAKSRGLSVLVEVHNEEELVIAQEIGADLIGVNNRNLKDLSISLETSFQLIQNANLNHCTMISESGLSQQKDLLALKKVGYRGFLIGSSLMKTGKPGAALQQLISEGTFS